MKFNPGTRVTLQSESYTRESVAECLSGRIPLHDQRNPDIRDATTVRSWRFTRWWLFFVFYWVLAAGAGAAQVKQVNREGAVDVLSEVGRAVEVVVPTGVASLVRSGLASSLKVEHVAGHLFITPLEKSAAELVVIDSAGRSYRLRFVFDKGLDEKILIEPKTDEGFIYRDGVTGLDLIREMASGRAPAGAVETLHEDVIFEDQRVRIKSVLIYEMPGLAGYVLTAENLLSQSLVVPVEQFNFPGLLAVTAQRDILSPAGSLEAKGVMYMVVSR